MGMDHYLEFKCRCTKKGVELKTVLFSLNCLLFGPYSYVEPPYSSKALEMLLQKGVFKNSFEYDAFLIEYKNGDDDEIHHQVEMRTRDIFVTEKEWKTVCKKTCPYDYAGLTIQQCPKCKMEIEVINMWL